jgi:hypothetical protein
MQSGERERADSSRQGGERPYKPAGRCDEGKQAIAGLGYGNCGRCGQRMTAKRTVGSADGGDLGGAEDVRAG